MPTSNARRVSRRELETDDLAAARTYLDAVYGANLRVQVLSKTDEVRPRMHHSRLEAEGFAVEDVRHGGEVETHGDDCTNVTVIWVKRGQVESTIRGTTHVAGPGEVILGSTGHAPVRLRTTDAVVRTAVITRKLVERVAADQGLAWRPVRFNGLSPINGALARVWTDTHEFVADSVLSEENSSPLIVSAAGRLLAAAVLSTFPIVDPLGPIVASPHDRPTVLRRAVAYIEEHAPREITVSDIAQAVYVTPRALQYMFRKHLGTTPMAYLRRVRLDRAHQDLLRADRASTTVAATASRWGFAHTGRFAVLYRDTYGRSPHVTLRG